MEKSRETGIIKECYGIVVLLDFLGVSLFTNEECKRFLSTRSEIMSHIDNAENILREQTGEFGKNLPKDFSIKSYAFGDNLLIAIALGESSNDDIGRRIAQTFALSHIATYLSTFFIYSLEQRYLFRGAISVGNYIESRCRENDISVIGEAVADAAIWHERGDWGGIMFTPKTSYLIEGWQYLEGTKAAPPKEGMELSNDVFRAAFTRYEVPLGGHERISLWTISWPYMLFQHPRAGNKNMALNYVHELISQMPIVKGTELKYQNTLEFARKYLEDWSEERVQKTKDFFVRLSENMQKRTNEATVQKL